MQITYRIVQVGGIGRNLCNAKMMLLDDRDIATSENENEIGLDVQHTEYSQCLRPRLKA